MTTDLSVIFTRFTIPEDEGQLVRNTGFMTAVADEVHAASLDNLDLATAGCLTAEDVLALLRSG